MQRSQTEARTRERTFEKNGLRSQSCPRRPFSSYLFGVGQRDEAEAPEEISRRDNGEGLCPRVQSNLAAEEDTEEEMEAGKARPMMPTPARRVATKPERSRMESAMNTPAAQITTYEIEPTSRFTAAYSESSSVAIRTSLLTNRATYTNMAKRSG